MAKVLLEKNGWDISKASEEYEKNQSMKVHFVFLNINRVNLVETFPKESEGMELIRILNQKVPIENKYYRISTY